MRNLFGKVVLPEIATQVLRSDLQLSGGVRKATILFPDLRDVTTLSEELPPTELLALLNRYLDRMSAVVEKHDGVIDKYIGDPVMALSARRWPNRISPPAPSPPRAKWPPRSTPWIAKLVAEAPLALGIGLSTG